MDFRRTLFFCFFEARSCCDRRRLSSDIGLRTSVWISETISQDTHANLWTVWWMGNCVCHPLCEAYRQGDITDFTIAPCENQNNQLKYAIPFYIEQPKQLSNRHKYSSNSNKKSKLVLPCVFKSTGHNHVKAQSKAIENIQQICITRALMCSSHNGVHLLGLITPIDR